MRGRSHYRQASTTMLGLLLVLLVTLVASPARSSSTIVLITAVYDDTYLTDEAEEAIRLMNFGESAMDPASWTLTDGEGTITLAGTLEGEKPARRLGLGRLLSPV